MQILCVVRIPDAKPASLFCANCDHDLCRECSASVHSAKIMAKHRVVDLAQKAAAAAPPQCEIHRGRPIDLYCIDCKVSYMSMALSVVVGRGAATLRVH